MKKQNHAKRGIPAANVTSPYDAQLACREAVLRIASALSLHPGDVVALVDLDSTFYEPDGYGYMVQHFGTDPAIWHAADKHFNHPDSTMTARELFQLALDICHENPEFSIAAVVQSLKAVHRTIPGTKKLVDTFAEFEVPVIAVTNGLVDLAEPLLAHHELEILAIGNWLDYAPCGKPIFKAIHGDHGLNKLLVAQMFAELGFRPIAGAGDSKSDIGLAKVAVEHGGFALARDGLGLARWCNENLPAESWRPYGEFCDGTVDWVRSKLAATREAAA